MPLQDGSPGPLAASLSKGLAALWKRAPLLAALLPLLPLNVTPDRLVECACIPLAVKLCRTMRGAVDIDFVWLEYGQRRRSRTRVRGLRKSDRLPCWEVPLFGTPLALRLALNVQIGRAHV